MPGQSEEAAGLLEVLQAEPLQRDCRFQQCHLYNPTSVPTEGLPTQLASALGRATAAEALVDSLAAQVVSLQEALEESLRARGPDWSDEDS